MSSDERRRILKIWPRGAKTTTVMVTRTADVRSGRIVQHMGSLASPLARVTFCFAEGQRYLELPVSHDAVFTNGVVALARRVFPVRTGYSVEFGTRPMSIIISRPDGMPVPREGLQLYVRQLAPDLAAAARRALGQA